MKKILSNIFLLSVLVISIGSCKKFLDLKPIDSPTESTFYVDEKGELSELKLIKSNCKSCEASVIQAINKMPKFSPAIEAGKAKKVKYIITYIQKI